MSAINVNLSAEGVVNEIEFEEGHVQLDLVTDRNNIATEQEVNTTTITADDECRMHDPALITKTVVLYEVRVRGGYMIHMGFSLES